MSLKIDILKHDARVRLDRLAEIRDMNISKVTVQVRDEMKRLVSELEQINADISSEKRAISIDESFRSGGNDQVVISKMLPLNEQIQAESRSTDRSTPIMENRISSFKPELRAESGSFKGSTFHDFLNSVRRAETPGLQADSRLFEQRASSGLNEGVGSEGGFLVPQDFSKEIFRNVLEVGQVASRCRSMIVTGNSLTLPAVDETSRATGSRFGGIQGYWSSEAETASTSKPKFRQITFSLKKLMALGFLTDELLEDSPAAGQIIAQGFADELAFLLDDAIINGDGVGKPLGLLQSPSLVTASKEVGQAPATLVYENILSMWKRMPSRNRANAVWFINQGIESQLYSMSLAVGTGGAPVYMPGGGVSGAPYAVLFGRPIVPIEQAAALGTKGDIVLADMSQYLLAMKGGGARLDVSMHVRFIYGESCYRAHLRVDGAPLWSSSLTPFKGSDSISPFVCLETRS